MTKSFKRYFFLSLDLQQEIALQSFDSIANIYKIH